MEIDTAAKTSSKKSHDRKKIEKRRGKKSSIVFPKYKDRQSQRKKR